MALADEGAAANGGVVLADGDAEARRGVQAHVPAVRRQARAGPLLYIIHKYKLYQAKQSPVHPQSMAIIYLLIFTDPNTGLPLTPRQAGSHGPHEPHARTTFGQSLSSSFSRSHSDGLHAPAGASIPVDKRRHSNRRVWSGEAFLISHAVGGFASSLFAEKTTAHKPVHLSGDPNPGLVWVPAQATLIQIIFPDDITSIILGAGPGHTYTNYIPRDIASITAYFAAPGRNHSEFALSSVADITLIIPMIFTAR